jgi:N-acetylneuraminic acid mutarotase
VIYATEITLGAANDPSDCPVQRIAAQIPPLPDVNGVAGAFAGVSGETLLVAGGANFPAGKPWEGGKKVWHDAVWACSRGAKEWTTVSCLAQPLAYGVSLTTRDGVMCIGGENSGGVAADVFLMQWKDNKL